MLNEYPYQGLSQTYPLYLPAFLRWSQMLDHRDLDFRHVPEGAILGGDENLEGFRVVILPYHLMVAIGMLFIVSTLYASWARMRGKLFENRRLLWYFVFAVVPAFAANELGWVTAQVGRQPWIVYPSLVDGQAVGGLRTGEALSEVVRSEQVIGSFIAFALIYAVLFLLWILVLNHKIQQGPEMAENIQRPAGSQLLDAAAERISHHGSLTEAKEA